MRPIVKKRRGEGSKTSLYLDDGILAAASYTKSKLITDSDIRDLTLAGLSINFAKSSLIAKQEGVYLGFSYKNKKNGIRCTSSKNS